MVCVAEATRLTGVADDRQRRTQADARQTEQHSHRGLSGEFLKLTIELGDAFLQRLDVCHQSSSFSSQALEVQPFLPAAGLLK